MTTSNYKPLIKTLILSVLTLGVYTRIWLFKTTNAIGESNMRPLKPMTMLILSFFIPGILALWYYKIAQKLQPIEQENNIEVLPGVVALCFSIVSPHIAQLVIQDKINEIVEATNPDFNSANAAPATDAPAADITSELQKFKELNDNGVITDEEFAAKKKELLGL